MDRTRVFQPIITLVFVGLLVFAFVRGRAPDSARVNTFGFTLTEVSKSIGVDFTHHAPRLDPKLDNIMPHVAGMGAAVSIVDADGDGWPDLYATNSDFGAPNALFLNQHDGTFRERAQEAGIGDVNRAGEGVSMGSVWADMDNDGDLDLYLYKWGYAQLFRNDGHGHFTDVTETAGLRRWMNSNAAVWFDYDRDGLVDLYVTGYFREDIDLWHLKTTRIMQESFEFAENGGHNVLWHNLGNGKFEDVTAKMGCDSTRWTLAVAAADMNGDGWQDLYLANDYGPEELFENDRGERFVRAEHIGLDESSKSGMSVSLGDFQNDGRLGVYVTNISKSGYLFQGNNLRLNRLGASGGFLDNVAQDAVVDCGWAWGAQFGDLNNDGRMDLYVVNGFVSASRERDYWFGMSKVAVGAGKLAEDAAFWPDIGDRSLSGYERSRVLVNQGRGRFVDAAESVGATDLLDGRAVAFADLFHRGTVDVVIANQKGPLLVYDNKVDAARHWIQFELVGTKSNRSAIGAEVTLTFEGKRTAQVVQAGSGFCAQNDLRLHFGLGSAAEVEKAVIRWPSGIEQTITKPKIDSVNRIEEPSA